MSSWMLTPRNKSFLRIWWLTLHIFPELRCNSSSTQNYDGFWVEVQFFSRQKFIFRPAVNNNQLCLDRWEPRVAINHPRVPPPLVSHHWVSLQRRTVKHLRWMRWKRRSLTWDERAVHRSALATAISQTFLTGVSRWRPLLGDTEVISFSWNCCRSKYFGSDTWSLVQPKAADPLTATWGSKSVCRLWPWWVKCFPILDEVCSRYIFFVLLVTLAYGGLGSVCESLLGVINSIRPFWIFPSVFEEILWTCSCAGMESECLS